MLLSKLLPTDSVVDRKLVSDFSKTRKTVEQHSTLAAAIPVLPYMHTVTSRLPSCVQIRYYLFVDSGSLWGGKEWQEYILQLLRLRYAFELVEIPDTVKGDCGIEAYSRDGCCYQCYAAEGSPSARERYEKNRDKLTRDVNKFTTRGKELSQLFGTTKIHRWVFLVPVHNNKELVKHAEKKAAEVRTSQLAHAHTDFAIQINTDSLFEVERNTLHSKGLRQLRLPPAPLGDTAAATYASSHSSQIAKLEKKLAKLAGLDESKAQLKSMLLDYYLQGENALSALREYPDVYEQVEACRANRTNFIRARGLISTRDPNARLSTTIEDFQNELCKAAPGLDAATAELLAWATTAGWLLDCPLDFPGTE